MTDCTERHTAEPDDSLAGEGQKACERWHSTDG